MGNIDTGGKRIIHLYNKAWIEWTLRQPVSVEAELSSDFQFIYRDSDSLLKVNGPEGPFLSLTELQFVYKREVPERLAAYAALAREKHKLDVFVTVIYFLPPPKDETVATAYHREFMGQTAHQDFQVISLWELEAKDALAFNNPVLLPFVPLMKGGNTVEMVQTCAERIQLEEHAEELKTFLALLAGYVLDKDLVYQILRWNMEIIENSPIIQDILAHSHRQGYRNALLQLLTFRFDIKDESLNSRFQSLGLKTLEQLFKTAVKVPTLADFERAFEAILSSKTKES